MFEKVLTNPANHRLTECWLVIMWFFNSTVTSLQRLTGHTLGAIPFSILI